MPFKDPEKRRQYRAAQMRNLRKTEKVPGLCSRYPECKNPTNGTHKLCDAHRAYAAEYRSTYRKRPKPVGVCSTSDCTNLARPGRKTCERCSSRQAKDSKTPKRRASLRRRRYEIRDEVLAAYGRECKCCGTTVSEFLTIDHIDGYKSGPRAGTNLYRWLKRHNFPDGFRVLCHSCNFALGHYGFCPHSELRQSCRVRSRKNSYSDPNKKELRREYWKGRKKEVFLAYGGFLCKCCGETNPECLGVDHINNDGAKHRKEVGNNLYIWLKKNNFPSGFQVLCHNCNFAKGHFGSCPHKRPSATLPPNAIEPTTEALRGQSGNGLCPL